MEVNQSLTECLRLNDSIEEYSGSKTYRALTEQSCLVPIVRILAKQKNVTGTTTYVNTKEEVVA